MIDQSELRRVLCMKRLARRWLVIAYWAIILLFIGTLSAVSQRQGFDRVDGPIFWFWWILILFPLFLRSIVIFSTRGSDLQTLMMPPESGRGVEPRPLDERELSLHLRIHTKAYYILRISVPMGVYLLTLMEIRRNAWLVFARLPLLWLMSVLVMSLPQSMILWAEPDLETEAQLPERLRQPEDSC